jgi:hypothetical protein
MPRHSVINRRNVASKLSRHTIHVSADALKAVTELAAQLSVSQGSVIDTALRELAAREPAEVIELLRRHDHLTKDEYDYVRNQHSRTKRGAR